MRKRKVITLILLGVFLAGLSLLLYPSVSSYWNSITQSRAIVDYDTIVKSLSPIRTIPPILSGRRNTIVS